MSNKRYFRFGIQTYSGANLISVCLLCMFGHKWRDLRNTLPLSADITTKQLICFFIAWLAQVPFVRNWSDLPAAESGD